MGLKGIWGKVLVVDVSNGSTEIIHLDDDFYFKHLGGRGISNYLLLKLTEKGYDPFSDESPIVISTGPLNLPGYPGGARCIIAGKSPLTGLIYESMAGGAFSWAIRGTGFDGIVIKGKSLDPIALIIDEGSIFVLKVPELKGKGTGYTEDFLKSKLGKSFQIASIGPAGEKGIYFSSIIHNYHRVFGRGGLGAVLGAKGIKAICVRGRKRPDIADSRRFKKIIKRVKEILKNHPYGERLRELGTGSGMEAMNSMGIIPTRYFSLTSFEGIEDISPRGLIRKGIMVDKKGCPSCPIKCIKVVRVPEMGIEEKWGGPEYETLVAFGSLIMNRDPKYISLIHKICNDIGIDTITTGGIVGMVIEAYENGILRKSDIGFEPRWGDPETPLKIIDLIMKGEKIGEVLAKGVKKASEILGIEDPVHVKGLEIPYQEPRGNVGMSISYATSFRGAVHTEGFRDTSHTEENSSPELGITSGMDIRDLKGKPEAVFKAENFRSFINSLVLCFFTVMITGPERNVLETVEAVNAVCGWDLNMEEAMRIGERNYMLGRIFMVREGIDGESDCLPKRFFKPSMDGRYIDERAFFKALKEYYRLRGFDEKGKPTEKKLKELSLDKNPDS